MADSLPVVPATHPPTPADASTPDHVQHSDTMHSHKQAAHPAAAGDHQHTHAHDVGDVAHTHSSADQVHPDHPDHAATHHDAHDASAPGPATTLPQGAGSSVSANAPVLPASTAPVAADEADPVYVHNGDGHHTHKHVHGTRHHHRHHHHHAAGDQPHTHDASNQLHGDNPQHEATHHRPHPTASGNN